MNQLKGNPTRRSRSPSFRLSLSPERPLDSILTPEMHSGMSEPSGSNFKKRKKTNDDDGERSGTSTNGGGGSRRGSAVPMPMTKAEKEREKEKEKKKGFSCSECHRRKQKCNRETPCHHCVARKVPDRCHPFTPGKPEDELLARLLRIEKILSLQFPQYNSSDALPDYPLPTNHPFITLSGGRSKGSEEESEDEELKEEDKDRGRGRLTKGKWFGVSAVQSMSEAPLLDKLRAENTTMNLLQAEHVAIELQLEDNSSPAENLQRLITECGVSPTKVAELVQELPPKDFANILVDWFFAKINFTRYPIHEGMFRVSYEALYANGLKTDPSNVRSLPLVFIILATAVRLSPEHIGGDDRTRRLTSLRYYWSSRRSILIATAIQSESLELVITRLLSSRYLIMVHDRRLTECWSQLGASLRTAQAIGLHRDGTKLGLDAFQTEYRRRIWSYLYHADRTYSLILGRPPAISDVYTDTLPPSNIEDSELVPGVAPEPRPLSEPTPVSYSVLRHSLSRIIGKITHYFQQLAEPSHYSDVLKLDDELNMFVTGLPAHFDMENPDKSLDGVYSAFLPMHRFFLHTEILFVRITLHRPWLLRKLKSDKFLVSRNACFESAKRDFVIRQAFKKESSVDVSAVMGGQFREFNAAMIAGISAIVDPHGSEGPDMRGILATFLDDHPPASAIDPTTKKERNIIETLFHRSVQLLNKESDPQVDPARTLLDPGVEKENHARTLLNLSGHQATKASPTASAAAAAHYLSRPPPSGGPSASASGSNQTGSSKTGHGGMGPDSTFSPGGSGSAQWVMHRDSPQSSSRMGDTPPSVEDESAQNLLDRFWQENLVLDTMGNHEQIFPSNLQSTATASLEFPGSGVNGNYASGTSMAGPSNDPLDFDSGVQPATPGDLNYWNSLINSILTQGGDTKSNPMLTGENGSR